MPHATNALARSSHHWASRITVHASMDHGCRMCDCVCVTHNLAPTIGSMYFYLCIRVLNLVMLLRCFQKKYSKFGMLVLYSWLRENHGHRNSLLLVKIHFWFFCLICGDEARLICWIFHQKLRVPTSEGEGKSSNPRVRRASAVHGENLRKFTETRAHVPCARYSHIYL